MYGSQEVFSIDENQNVMSFFRTSETSPERKRPTTISDVRVDGLHDRNRRRRLYLKDTTPSVVVTFFESATGEFRRDHY